MKFLFKDLKIFDCIILVIFDAMISSWCYCQLCFYFFGLKWTIMNLKILSRVIILNLWTKDLLLCGLKIRKTLDFNVIIVVFLFSVIFKFLQTKKFKKHCILGSLLLLLYYPKIRNLHNKLCNNPKNIELQMKLTKLNQSDIPGRNLKFVLWNIHWVRNVWTEMVSRLT